MIKKITEQDRERILFSAGFGKEINNALSANISDPDAEKIVTQTISAYKAAGLPPLTPEWIGKGAPADSKEWVVAYFSDYFKIEDSRPKWLGEPSWIFLNGFPMTFIHQTTGVSNLSDDGKRMTYFFRSNEHNGIDGMVKSCVQEEDPDHVVITFEQ